MIGLRQIFVVPCIVTISCTCLFSQAVTETENKVAGKGLASEFERLPSGEIRLGKITVHPQDKNVSFPAEMNLKRGVLEVLIATPEGRLHESLLCSEAEPLHLQTALYLIGLKNGPLVPDVEGRCGDVVDIVLEYEDENKQLKRAPVEDWISNVKTGAVMQRHGWLFIGSSVVEGRFQAEVGGNLALVYNIGDSILELASEAGDDDTNFVVNEKNEVLELNEQVRVILIPRGKNK